LFHHGMRSPIPVESIAHHHDWDPIMSKMSAKCVCCCHPA
jgi:hypothetical protein